jgi:hypothetical protein
LKAPFLRESAGKSEPAPGLRRKFRDFSQKPDPAALPAMNVIAIATIAASGFHVRGAFLPGSTGTNGPAHPIRHFPVQPL